MEMTENKGTSVNTPKGSPPVSTHNFSIAEFKKAQDGMISINTSTSNSFGSGGKNYDREGIERVIERGSIGDKRDMSRAFFDKGGFYQRIIIYYATLLKYSGVLIPHRNMLSNSTTIANNNLKKYYTALDFIDRINVPNMLVQMTLNCLIDGVYYGAIQQLNKNRLIIIDLPISYCRTRFKDLEGNNIVEFDVKYFDKITNEQDRESALKAYPPEISKAYKKFSRGSLPDSWIMLPPQIGFCFQPVISQQPLFLSTILASSDYSETVDTEKLKDKEEIKKIVVQKIPHNNENALLFEPIEAEEMHRGAVEMLKRNKQTSVLTTYADVEVVASKTTNDSLNNNLEKMANNVYREAGVSGQLFGSDNSATLMTSIDNDTSMMMNLFGVQYSSFLSKIINKVFGNNEFSFTYSILPITYYNSKDYMDSTYKLATAGYSFLLPAIASGLSQKDLVGIKELENNVLKLDELLKPLSIASTQKGNDDEGEGATPEGGAPKKEQIDKKETTLRKEKSKETDGGEK